MELGVIILILIIKALILFTFILAILSLYWAVLFRVEEIMGALVVWVVNFDGQVAPYQSVTPMVGPQIVQAAEKLIAPSGPLGGCRDQHQTSIMIQWKFGAIYTISKLGQLLSSMQTLLHFSRMLFKLETLHMTQWELHMLFTFRPGMRLLTRTTLNRS